MTNAANAVTIEGLESQLAAEKSKCAEATALAASKEALVEVERRNYSAVQELLATTRKESEEWRRTGEAAQAECQRLTGVVAEFAVERKTWSALQQSLLESKVQVEKMSGQLEAGEKRTAELLKELETMTAEKRSWELLRENYMAAKAECDKLREEKVALEAAIAAANDKVTGLEREKLELIGSLTTVSKEWEIKNEKIAHERKREMAEFQRKLDELSSEVLKLTERNTLLSADKIKLDQLQRDYDKLKSSGGFTSEFAPATPAPTPAPAGNSSVEVDGTTQIVVQCGHHSSANDEAQRAHLIELQEKNQLLTRLAGLHEAMEKIRYEPLYLDAPAPAPAPSYSNTHTHTHTHASMNHTVLDHSNISYASEGPPMPSAGRGFGSSVDQATCGIKWEGGPINGLGWSSYYLRDSKPRAEVHVRVCTR